MFKSRIAVLTSMVLAAAASRLIPHPPNYTPMIALALFGGTYFTDRKTAYILPLAAMVLSDIGLAFLKGYEFFTAMRLVIYGCFALISTMGFVLRHYLKTINVIAASLAGSTVFFIITNLAVWAEGYLYPLNMAGLAQCYIAAIPFFGNTVLSALFYSGLLFGLFEFAQQKIPALAESRI